METVSCNLCGSDRAQPLLSSPDRRCGVEGTFSVVQCLSCGLIYLNPRPDASSIGRYYPSAYSSYDEPVHFPVATDFRGARGWLRGQMFVRGSPLGTVLRGYYVRWLGNWRWFYAADPARRGGRVLDLGSGAGQTLSLFKQFGWECCGVDSSPHAVEPARRQGLTVHLGQLAEARFPNEHFDLVWICHTLEHLHDPRATLQEVRRILKPAGTVCLEIPLAEGALPRLFGPYNLQWECPRHLYHFSRRTLRRMIEFCGFRLRVLDRGSSPWVFSMSLSYFLEDRFPRWAQKIRRPLSDHPQRKLWFPILWLIAAVLRILGQGEALVVELRK